MKKKCCKCKREKEIDGFSRKGSGHQPLCKECNKAYLREHYKKNKDYYKKKAKTHKQKIISKYSEYKEGLACSRCGESHPACLVFHHTSAKKENVSRLVSYSWNAVLQEIKKCTVLCANCHRKLHYDIKRNSSNGGASAFEVEC